MASKDELLYQGKRKENHLKDAVGALVSATTPYGRYKIYKEGFLKFEPIARRLFREEANLPFTSIELRCVFDSLVLYINKVDRKNGHRPMCRKKYAYERRTGTMNLIVSESGHAFYVPEN